MINGFCKNKPKTEICRNCSNAIEVTNPFDDVRHFVPGPGGFCARDEKQVTKQQAIAFWHSIPVSERKQKYGGLSDFLLLLKEKGYIKNEKDSQKTL